MPIYIENKEKELNDKIIRNNKLANIINNISSLKYYFKHWKDLSILNKQTEFDKIDIIENPQYKKRIKNIPGKKILQFSKIEKEKKQIYRTKTPILLGKNIINHNENKNKKKLLKKFVIKKEEEKNQMLRRYLNIWKYNIQSENNENEINLGSINKNIPNKNNKKIITYKKRKIEEINQDIINELEHHNNNNKINLENNNNNLYIKHRAQTSNFISSIKNNNNNLLFTNNEKKPLEENDNNNINNDIINENNNINNDNDNDFVTEGMKKFNLPMPNKVETKECPLILNPFENEEIDDINLNLKKSEIKKAPNIPKINFKKKENENRSNIDNIIDNKYNTDNEILGGNRNQYMKKIIPNTNSNSNNSNNIFENEKEIDLENNKDKNEQIINKISNITTESDNIISLKNDPSIENNDFGHKAKVNKNITYKKIIKKAKDINKYDNEKNIGRNLDKKRYNFESKHIKSKTFLSDNIDMKKEINGKIKKFNLSNKINKKEYTINYNDIILCEEIVYKSNDVMNENLLNIKTVKKPKKLSKNKTKILFPNFSPEVKKESIFVQRVIRYKNQERKYGYGNYKSPIRLPINPNGIELQISALSPFTKSSNNFFRKENKNKFEEITPNQDICITDRGNKKDTIDVFNSSKINNSYENNNNNIFDNSYSDNYENIVNEINDQELKDKINNELLLTKKLIDFHTRFMKNSPDNWLNKIQPNILFNIIKKENEKLSLLKLFYLYEKYNTNKYLIKKLYFLKWLRAINFINMNIGKNNIHIINKLGHCISAKHIVIKEIGCGLHSDDNYINCSCWKIKMYLQKILLRHYLLKNIEPRKYYLFKWYKNTFKKIRPLFMRLA